jgi:diaminohydroxyphosphoribosylaminopyrimidine deaminase/5-amino-6-(5-phosphoribosylamino)uracil reductase
LQIAKNGIGTTRPNPSVGAVIVCKGVIVGEGFTAAYGGNHAEVNAVNSVEHKNLLVESTLYVTLEPCSHFGKTPPCADLIIKYNIKRVVIGCVDTNSLVAGQGIERLKSAGVVVIVGVLEAECRTHHKRFFAVQEKKRPYIILKWAETKDGFVAPLSKDAVAPKFISNRYSQQLVHKLRSQEHAILVGKNTVLEDNPKLNVRSWSGNNPIRVVLDSALGIPESAHVFDGSITTIVITGKIHRCEEVKTKKYAFNKNLIFEPIDFSKNVAKQICTVLIKHQVQSLIVEGGTQTLATFISENLWDEALVFVGDHSFDAGVKAPRLDKNYKKEHVLEDLIKKYTND